jgi:hypothetical protein
MIEANSSVQVTLSLSKGTYERLEQAAFAIQKRPEDLLNSLVTEGLDTQSRISEILERISTEYRNRLSKEGKLDQSSEGIIQELRDVREQIAYELYS